MQPTQVPADVAGERVRYAEHQPQYQAVDTARQRDPDYDCFRLVTASIPEQWELERFANAVLDAMPESEVPVLPGERAMVEALKAAFEAHPVLLSQLTGSGVMTPHNLHLGTAPYLTTPSS